MANDPYTLVVALDTPKSAAGGKAVGDLYLDDGHTYDHKNKGAFARRRFEWSGNTLTSKEAPAPYGNPKADALELAPSVTVERILIWGWHGKPTKVTITEAGGEARELELAPSVTVERILIWG